MTDILTLIAMAVPTVAMLVMETLILRKLRNPPKSEDTS